MIKTTEHLQLCKKLIEQKLNWGLADSWKTRDFEELSSLIFDQTGISLSTSTLRRIWGHSIYENQPNVTTLDALASFAGFKDWRTLQRSNDVEKVSKNENSSDPTKRPIQKNQRYAIGVSISLVLILVIFSGGRYALNSKGKALGEYMFEAKRTTDNIPNTVIFKYDVKGLDEDSVYIQQSWDPAKKVKVNKNSRTHSSIYYEPGVHHAKLIVGDHIVKEEMVIIPTKGWVCMIENGTDPIYIENEDFIYDSLLTLSEAKINSHAIDMKTAPKYTQYYNVGNFKPIPLKDLNFSSDIRHDFSQGASYCQFSYIILYTDNGIIMMPYSQKGCVGKLNLVNLDSVIKASETDLSGFGIDLTNWVNVTATAVADTLIFSIDKNEVFSVTFPQKDVNVFGIGYFFKGTGSVRNVTLTNNGEIALKDLS